MTQATFKNGKLVWQSRTERAKEYLRENKKVVAVVIAGLLTAVGLIIIGKR